MANQTQEAKRGTQLTRSLRLLLSRYLDALLAIYLRQTKWIKDHQGETSWNYLLFESDIINSLDLMEYPCSGGFLHTA